MTTMKCISKRDDAQKVAARLVLGESIQISYFLCIVIRSAYTLNEYSGIRELWL